MEFVEIIAGFLIYESIFYTFAISDVYLKVHNRLMNFDPKNSDSNSILSVVGLTKNSTTSILDGKNSTTTGNNTMSKIERTILKAYQGYNRNIVNEAFVFKNALNLSLLFAIKVAASLNYLITLPILRYSYNKIYFSSISSCSRTDFTRSGSLSKSLINLILMMITHSIICFNIVNCRRSDFYNS